MEFESLTKLGNEQSSTARVVEQEADYGLTLMASTLAHEIRNPLQAIRLQLDALSRGSAVLPAVDSIQQSMARLEGVAGRIQKLGTRIIVHPESVHLKDLLESVVSSLSVWFSAAQVKVKTFFDWEGEAQIEADSQLLEQLMINLVMNAIQAMPQGGELQIELHEELDHALIEVRDTGIGMSEADLARAGTPFFTTKAGGSGLGLSFCKMISHLHNGSLKLESEAGKGTLVAVQIAKSTRSEEI